MKKISVLDYGLGNIRSVCNAIKAVGATPLVSKDKEQISYADGLIIPGVGAFSQGMSFLKNENLIEVITDFIASNKPVLGICLGMQMLFETGMEFERTEGLGLISGKVDKLALDGNNARLPHIAWETVIVPEFISTPIYDGLDEDQRRFYFVHSYAASDVSNKHVTGLANYGGQHFVASVQKNNVWGTQFHPEKSGVSGLRVLRNFVESC